MLYNIPNLLRRVVVASKNFNKTHPELRDGEVWISNVSFDFEPMLSIDSDLDDRSGWEQIGWKSKRMGNVAYDIYGNPINGMRPVFARRIELQKAGVNPERLS